MKIHLYIYFFILYLDIIYSYITFPLLKDLPNFLQTDSSSIKIKKSFDSNLYIIINIGSENKDVKVYLSMERFELMIAGRGISTHIYDENTSESYNCSYCVEKEFSYGKYNKGIISTESMNIKFNNNEIKKINNINFILGTSSIYLNPHQGFVGLILPYYDSSINYNLFYSLKNTNITGSYNWYLNFTENDNSNMVLDILPHELNNQKYNKSNYKTIKAVNDGYYLIWALNFDNAYYDNEKNNISLMDYTQAKFDFSIKYILAPNETGVFFENNFFEEYYKKNLCFKEQIEKDSQIYYFIYCSNTKDFNINKFKNIYFKHIELNSIFELNYKDLFYIDNNYIYFLILFHDEIYWSFGELFLNKYTFVFNPDQKTIGFYQNFLNDKKSPEPENTNIDFYKILYIVLLSLILIGVIIVLIVVFQKKGKRKNRANEMDDDYEYMAKKENEDNDRILSPD